ncbi:MAG: arginine repressor [Clostridia bacterium]|nr:arginine repressor [Clostridia bacterium]
MRLERQYAIQKLIKEEEIETQAALTQRLSQIGYDVTQATVSRDIREMGLMKKLSNGRYIYALSDTLADSEISDRFEIIFRKCVTAIDYALNNIVVKTLPGMAQAAGAALDTMHLSEVVGTIAGDDTVFMVVRNEESARRLVYKLRALTDI